MKKLTAVVVLLVAVAVLSLNSCTERLDESQLEEHDGLIYKKGESEPFTGEKVWKFENGQKMGKSNYKDGKEDGLQVDWYENGMKKHEHNYRDGKKDGLQVGWFENGQIKYEHNYKDGKEDDWWGTWSKNGKIRHDVYYKDGELVE